MAPPEAVALIVTNLVLTQMVASLCLEEGYSDCHSFGRRVLGAARGHRAQGWRSGVGAQSGATRSLFADTPSVILYKAGLRAHFASPEQTTDRLDASGAHRGFVVEHGCGLGLR